jgi:putative acetyltransferase
MIEIREDDLSGRATLELVELHLRAMHESSPPGHVFALDTSGLRRDDVTVWTAWIDGEIAGMVALRRLNEDASEVKSMRTHPRHLRRGVAARLLDHLIAEARARGTRRLLLETGSGQAFDAAIALYVRRGFVPTEAFGEYEKSAFNQFFALDLASE